MEDARCDWCDRPFRVRTTGGHAQRFCREACRRALDRAGRRFIAEAIADGTLTPAALKSGYAATRALLFEAVSPQPIDPDRTPAALLDALMTALLKLPPDELSWLIYYRLPGELGETLRDRMKPENRSRFPSRPR
jgi:hypothetical protein